MQDKINIIWNKDEIKILLENNISLLKEYILELHFQDYQIKEVLNERGNKLLLEYKLEKYRKEGDLEIDLLDYETLLKLGYSNLIEIFKKINILKMEECKEENISERMLELHKNIMSPIIKIDNYMIKITEGNIDNPYYIASFIPLDKYNKNKEYLDQSIKNFKAASDKKNCYFTVFELNKYPKAKLNLTGEAFYKKNTNSFELFRGILLSYVYFGNNKFND
jgi:hypothetical protein